MKTPLLFTLYSAAIMLTALIQTPGHGQLYPKLLAYIQKIDADKEQLPADRKAALNDIAKYIVEKRSAGKDAHVTFVCTGNSRRSMMSQAWAQAFADYYGVNNFYAFSGGTEPSAFHTNAIHALRGAGFSIEDMHDPKADVKNPVYAVGYSPDKAPVRYWSKHYDDPANNPKANFCVVMVCADADKSCPFVPGAEVRVPLHYEDPKAADHTPQETQAYDERCKQIATEMDYLMSQVKAQLGTTAAVAAPRN